MSEKQQGKAQWSVAGRFSMQLQKLLRHWFFKWLRATSNVVIGTVGETRPINWNFYPKYRRRRLEKWTRQELVQSLQYDSSLLDGYSLDSLGILKYQLGFGLLAVNSYDLLIANFISK